MHCTLRNLLCSQEYRKYSKPFITKSSLSLLASIVLLFAGCPALYSQARGSFSGNVSDKSGSAVPGAAVTVTAQTTGQSRAVKTDDAGHYDVPLLSFGTYNVRVDATGFQSAETKDLQLHVDEARELDFTLTPATVVTTVTVSSAAVAVETANPSLGQVITSQEVAQLPLNGRDFVQLATLTAGATAETNPNSFFTQGSDSEVAARGSFSLSVGGSRPNSTDWLLDGVDNNELTAGGIGVFSSIDDIQEFKVLTYTYSAEFGTRAGPTVLVTTKSGTNDYHGSLFEFVRNTDLDAKADFDTTTPKFNLNQFGGSFGGPLRRNKMFFFVDGEQKYQREGITFTGLVPSLAMRGGDFSLDPFGNPVLDSNGNVVKYPIANPNMFGAADPYFQCDASGNPIPANADGSQVKGTDCSKIPSNLIDSVGKGMISIYPTPNANNPSQGYNYVNEPVRSLNETKFDIRFDQTISSKDNAFERFSYDQAFSFVPGGAPTLAESNAFGSNENLINHARNIALGWSHVFSPTTLNTASVGYDRIFDYIDSLGNFTCGSTKLGIPGADLGCSSTGSPIASDPYSQGVVSAEVYGGYWSLGDRGYSPFQGGTDIFSYKDVVDLIRGKHEIRTGIDLRDNQMNVGTEEFQDGFWLVGAFGNFSGAGVVAGNSEADLLMGMAGGAIHDQTYYGPITGRRWKIIRPFVEDDWRATPSLVLNLGLAWDMTTPITEIHNRMADYIPQTGQLLIAGQNGVEPVRRHQYVLGRIRAPRRPYLEGPRQRQDRSPPRLWHVSRFFLEPGRPGLVAKSARPWRVRPIPHYLFRRLRLCHFLLRHHPRTDAGVKLHHLYRLSAASQSPNCAYLPRDVRLPAAELPAGPGSPIQRERRAPAARQRRPHRRIRGFNRRPSAGHWQRPQHQQPLSLRKRDRLYAGLPAQRRSLHLPVHSSEL